MLSLGPGGRCFDLVLTGERLYTSGTIDWILQSECKDPQERTIPDVSITPGLTFAALSGNFGVDVAAHGGCLPVLNDGCCHSHRAGSGWLCVHSCSFWTAAQTDAGEWSGACTPYPHPRHHSASACSAGEPEKTLWARQSHQGSFTRTGPSVWLWVILLVFIRADKSIYLSKTKYIKWTCVEWYRQGGTRLEHLKRVDDPLVVRAQQRADVFARGVAQPLGHTGPAPFLTDHLETAFVCHDLKRTSWADRLLNSILSHR